MKFSLRRKRIVICDGQKFIEIKKPNQHYLLGPIEGKT